MSNGPARRQLLKAAAASSIVAPVAGCIDTLETADDGTGDSTPDDGSERDAVPNGPACELGKSIVAAFGDGDFETAVSYYPYEYVADEEVDPTAIAADLEDGSLARLEWVDADIDDISCECAAPYPDAARSELTDDFAGEITDVLELRYSVTYDADGGTATAAAFVRAIEIDGDWYGIFSHLGSPDLCGTRDTAVRDSPESGAGDDTADDRPLERADWEDVEEIVLEGTVRNWVGVEPAPIEGLENPTLLLFEGREYTIEWINGDGVPHNLQIRDEDDDALVETDLLDQEGASESLTVEATAAMDSYVCAPHESTMAGAIEVEDEAE